MKNVTKALIIAVDVIIVCLLITLIFREYHLSAQLENTNAQKLADSQSEIMVSSIESLEGVSLKGTTVINAVKKYKDEIPVEVITESGKREFNSQAPFLNVIAKGEIGMNGAVSQTGETIIDPDGIFFCTHETNLNDVITKITFTQKGVNINTSGDASWTVESVRNKLVQILTGFDGVDSASMGELLSIINDNLSYEDKCELANFLGVQPTATFGELVNEVEAVVNGLQTSLSEAERDLGEMYVCKTGTQTDNSDGDLTDTSTFTSCPVMAYVQDNVTMCTYYYYGNADSGFWVSNDDPNFDGSSFDKLAFVKQAETANDWYLYSKLSSVTYTVFYKK